MKETHHSMISEDILKEFHILNTLNKEDEIERIKNEEQKNMSKKILGKFCEAVSKFTSNNKRARGISLSPNPDENMCLSLCMYGHFFNFFFISGEKLTIRMDLTNNGKIIFSKSFEPKTWDSSAIFFEKVDGFFKEAKRIFEENESKK